MARFSPFLGEVLQKNCITGTETTMSICKTLLGRINSKITYRVTCSSGFLGGDAQIALLIPCQRTLIKYESVYNNDIDASVFFSLLAYPLFFYFRQILIR